MRVYEREGGRTSDGGKLRTRLGVDGDRDRARRNGANASWKFTLRRGRGLSRLGCGLTFDLAFLLRCHRLS